jgi:hypothetical protein
MPLHSIFEFNFLKAIGILLFYVIQTLFRGTFYSQVSTGFLQNTTPKLA